MASEGTAATPLGPAVAISTSIALAATFVVGALLWGALPETPLPFGFASQHQDAETATYLVAFVALTPLGIVLGLRSADRIAAGRNAALLPKLAAGLVAGLEVVVVASRLALELPTPRGLEVLAAGAVLWGVACVAVLRRARSDRPWSLPGSSRTWWGAAVLLCLPVLRSFTDLGSASWPVVGVGLAVSVLAAALVDRWEPRHLPGHAGRLVDAGAVLLVALAVPNVVVLTAGDGLGAFDREVVQFHQNFFLGPANQVLAGDALLVDVLSQYGVGSIYFLAAAFALLPIGNGTLALVEGGLSALVFAGTYLVLRLSGVTRRYALPAIAVGVVALVFGLRFPLGSLLQHGAIRFGMPVGVVLGAVVTARRPAGSALGPALVLVTMGVASVWALESFAYSALTALACAAVLVAMEPPPARRAAGRRWALQLAGAVVAAHGLLAAGTLAATGELPRWGWYLATLREFLVGPLGELTYDFSSFSPGLVLGPVYVASASGLAVLLARRRDLHAAHGPALVAIAGVTAYGVALLSYLVNRSADHIVPYVSLPAVALVALWLEVLRAPELAVSRPARRTALVGALAAGTVLVAVTWPTVQERYPQSALAQVVPGGRSLPTALRALRDLPALQPGAVEGAALLEQHLPDEARSIVLTSADLSVEVLVRAERGNRVPLGDPWEDSFVPEGHLDALGAFVDELELGDRALLDAAARAAFEEHQRDPDLDPFAPQEGSLVPRGLASLQRWVLREVALRYDLRAISVNDSGLEVVELVPRADGP